MKSLPTKNLVKNKAPTEIHGQKAHVILTRMAKRGYL
jgi:hypothetical protein